MSVSLDVGEVTAVEVAVRVTGSVLKVVVTSRLAV